jgi:lysine 6-dehydrogenase
MSAIEDLTFDGVGKLEAFYTSGGTSTLPDTYEGKVDFLDYKTIRYPGHCELFRPMLEIGLASRESVSIDDHHVPPRAVFRSVLDRNLTFNDPDMVLVRVTIDGQKNGKKTTLTYEILDRQDVHTGLTAMMRTTAFPAAIIAGMAAQNQLTDKGCKPQEMVVPAQPFIAELKKRHINVVKKEAAS